MKNNQTKNEKSINFYDKAQSLSIGLLFIILILGMVIYMAESSISNKKYNDLAAQSFSDLLAMNNLNENILKDSPEQLFENTKNLSPDYIPIRNLLIGDAYFKNNSYEKAKSFYNLADNQKALFMQKGIQNRLVFISFK